MNYEYHHPSLQSEFLHDEYFPAQFIHEQQRPLDPEQQSDMLAAERERAHLQAVMNQAPLGLIIVEAPSGKILVYNEEASRLLGHALLESDTYLDYGQYHGIHDDGTPLQANEYPTAKALLSGEVVRDETVLYRVGENLVRRLAVSAAPIRDRMGAIVSVVCTFYDISEQYELSQQKDEFIQMASHELKTPLTTIKGNLQLALRRLSGFAVQDAGFPVEEGERIKQTTVLIERALRQVDIQQRLVDDLVDTSRLQVKKLQIAPSPCNILDLVTGVVEDVRLTAPNRRIDLQLPGERTIMLVVDRNRISQVVNNYLTNAIKYSPVSLPITVGVSLGRQTLRVWVKDQGPGLSKEDQQRVWELFYQVKGRKVQQHSGGVNIGLGLHICRELIQLHGGTVGVKSTKSQGSCFWFQLPYQHESN